MPRNRVSNPNSLQRLLKNALRHLHTKCCHATRKRRSLLQCTERPVGCFTRDLLVSAPQQLSDYFMILKITCLSHQITKKRRLNHPAHPGAGASCIQPRGTFSLAVWWHQPLSGCGTFRYTESFMKPTAVILSNTTHSFIQIGPTGKLDTRKSCTSRPTGHSRTVAFHVFCEL